MDVASGSVIGLSLSVVHCYSVVTAKVEDTDALKACGPVSDEHTGSLSIYLELHYSITYCIAAELSGSDLEKAYAFGDASDGVLSEDGECTVYVGFEHDVVTEVVGGTDA